MPEALADRIKAKADEIKAATALTPAQRADIQQRIRDIVAESFRLADDDASTHPRSTRAQDDKE